MKIGRVCLLGIINLYPLLKAQDDVIVFPKDPPIVIPPQRGEEGAQEDYGDKMQYWKMKEKYLPSGPSYKEKRNAKLLEESLAPRSLNFELSLSVLMPYIKVKGDRKNYKIDPSVAIHTIFRPQKSQNIQNLQIYLGIRSCFFSGSGIYENIFAHFNLIYLSPIIGVGKIYLAQKDVSKDAEKDKKHITKYLKPHVGWMLLSGIAVQTRYVNVQGNTATVPEELQTKSIDLKETGIWVEAFYKNIYFGAIGLNLLSGIQFGKGKTLYYVGIGASGWN